jgi:hypothetical protein
MDKLLIHQWNANGILGKLSELKQYLQNYQVRLMAINETKITDSHKIKIKNYQILRKDRDIHGGGIALLIRDECLDLFLKFGSF